MAGVMELIIEGAELDDGTVGIGLKNAENQVQVRRVSADQAESLTENPPEGWTVIPYEAAQIIVDQQQAQAEAEANAAREARLAESAERQEANERRKATRLEVAKKLQASAGLTREEVEALLP